MTEKDILEVLPTPQRCQGECGRGQVCCLLIYRNGYCLKPSVRKGVLETFPEDVRKRINLAGYDLKG